MTERPLSPHWQVYKFKYTLTTSFLNRVTGVVLSLGLIVLAYWLMAVASGGRAYTQALAVLSTLILKLLYAALLISFCYHLVAGIRHLIWDTGRYMERAQSKRSAAIISVVSVLLMVVCLYFAFFAGAHAP
ncbi:MAG TPA: succinate dehydrogenase, cytochrome b556 subunit [Steroidobacteraceae bacterium]|nr:succinate dehydrogenase, cytochrome b556 subunit [Steroidobacteraceae bacterium]